MNNNKRLYQWTVQLCLLATLGLPAVEALAGWDRYECNRTIVSMLESKQVVGNDTTIFAVHPPGHIMSDISNIALTPDGCSRVCGTEVPIPYRDSVPRLTQWLLPVFLLIVNMQFAPIGWKRFLSVLHLLGDPIDSIWSLLSKVEIWNRCFIIALKINGALAAREEQKDNQLGNNDKQSDEDRQNSDREIRNIAVIIGAVEELIHPFHPKKSAGDVFQDFQAMLIVPNMRRDVANQLYWKTASDLINSRTNEMRRTCFSIGLYLFQVIAAFAPEVGEASSPSGGRIGMAILFSWLLPTVLLSNAIGDFASRSHSLRIMLSYMEEMNSSGRELFRRRLKLQTATSHFDSLAWSGAIFSYRQEKRLFNVGPQSYGHHRLALISVIPVILSCATASGVLWTKPTNFTCRHFLIIGVLVAWLLSASFTWCIARFCPGSGACQWYVILVKDALIAIPTMGLIIGSSCGLFNNCRCWGMGSGRVYLNPITDFDFNNHVYYPAWIGTCLWLQLGVFVLIRWLIGRNVFKIMRWSEEEKQAEVLARLQASTQQADDGKIV